MLFLQICKREEKRQEELARLRIENEEEIRRLQEEAQAAAEQRQQQQADAIQRRREMDLVLAEQLEERSRRQLEDAELERSGTTGASHRLRSLTPSFRSSAVILLVVCGQAYRKITLFLYIGANLIRKLKWDCKRRIVQGTSKKSKLTTHIMLGS